MSETRRAVKLPELADPPAHDGDRSARHPQGDQRDSDPAAAEKRRSLGARKLAVVLIHGMGEQVPMETLRSFVETMWVRDPDLHARRPDDPDEDGNPVWWKPDVRTGSPELSRITTRAGRTADGSGEGPRTDFYELYWADLTEGNTLAQFRDWFRYLLWRPYPAVPADVRSIWFVLWALTLMVAGLLGYRALVAIFPWWLALPDWLATVMKLSAIGYSLLLAFILSYFGDVPRYTRSAPTNIAARKAIRERGLAVINAIEAGDQYERIVLVDHSLGSILA